MNKKSFKQKPTAEEAGGIKLHQNNEIVTTDVFDLANRISQGYSFHASVLDYNINTGISKKTGEPQKGLNDTCFTLDTQLFAVDIDHANMSYELINSLMYSSGVKPAIVYKTMSYSEDNKRWRVLFLANRPVKSKEEFEIVQKSLTWIFAKHLNPKTFEEKVDFSCVDYSRLSFPCCQDGIVLVQDETFDIDTFVKENIENETLKRLEIFKAIWKEEERLRNGKKTTTKKKTNSKAGSNDKVETTNEYNELAPTIFKNLSEWSLNSILTVTNVDVYESFDFINQIPISYLIEQDLYSKFSCVLPHHRDSVPSANIVENDNGRERYYCFACCEDGHGLSTWDVIREIITHELDYNEYEVLKAVFEALGIELGSEYQKSAREVINYNNVVIERLGMEDKLIKSLSRQGLLGTYTTLMTLASNRLPLYSLTNNKDDKNPSVFLSTEFVTQYAKSIGLRGHSDRIKVTRKINKLAKMGLIRKLAIEEIDEETLQTTQDYRLKAIERELAFTGGTPEEQAKKRLINEKTINFITIYPLSLKIRKKAEDEIDSNKEKGVRAKGFSMKQTLASSGKEKAEEVFPQMTCELSKRDKLFIKHMLKAVDELMDKQGYFTEKQLITAIDKKGKHFKKAEKELKFAQFEQIARDERNITSSYANKENREALNIPTKIKCNNKIYIYNK